MARLGAGSAAESALPRGSATLRVRGTALVTDSAQEGTGVKKLNPHSIYGIRERAHNMERGFRGSPLEYGNMEIWSRFCRVPRFFWCFDFFSEYLQKSLYISIFLYFV